MLVLGLDFETTGLDLKEARIIEVGAVLWDVAHKVPVKVMNACMWDESYPPITAKITELTGITQEHLHKHAEPPKVVFEQLADLYDQADYIIAFNGTGFDKPIFNAEIERQGGFPATKKNPWLDAALDLPVPPGKMKKLTLLAAEHHYINYFPHRALFDVLAMMWVVSKYPFEEILRYSQTPSIVLQAIIPKPWEDGGRGRDQAKELGYRFDDASKAWVKSVKQFDLENEIKAAPFKIVQQKGKSK